MLKGKLVVLSLIAVALLCWQVMPASVDSANSGIVDPCSTSASSAGGCWVICPQGDGPPLNALSPAAGDGTIFVTVKDQTGAPVVGVPAADFWLLGWTDNVVLCGGSGSINATAATIGDGTTTIAGSWGAGGCDNGVIVVVQSVVILDPNNWTTPLCLPVLVRSPDVDGSLAVDLVDFAMFGDHWQPAGKPYGECWDYDCDADVDLTDFAVFGGHWLHLCL
jgi:hypothetical protein